MKFKTGWVFPIRGDGWEMRAPLYYVPLYEQVQRYFEIAHVLYSSAWYLIQSIWVCLTWYSSSTRTNAAVLHEPGLLVGALCLSCTRTHSSSTRTRIRWVISCGVDSEGVEQVYLFSTIVFSLGSHSSSSQYAKNIERFAKNKNILRCFSQCVWCVRGAGCLPYPVLDNNLLRVYTSTSMVRYPTFKYCCTRTVLRWAIRTSSIRACQQVGHVRSSHAPGQQVCFSVSVFPFSLTMFFLR